MAQRHFSSGMNNVVLAVGIVCIAYYLASGLYVRFGQSMLWVWPVVGLACVARFFLVRAGMLNVMPLWIIYVARTGLALCLAFFLATEGILISGMTQSPPENLDYLIVLGARVNGKEPSLSLQLRTQRAAAYMKEHPDTMAILSGGQGEDEEISEAACMLNLMAAEGIDLSRVLVEEKSTSTAQNIRFSYALIDDPTASVGVVTNGYHVFRAILIARSNGEHPVSGVSAPSSLLLLPHNLTREFMTMVVGGLRGDFKLDRLFH